MSRRDFLAKVALVAALLALAGCGWFAERWEWNQKLTVEVLVDGEIASGSAVSYVRWQEADALDNYSTAYRGEATVVDLGERGVLFALIGEATKYVAGYTLHEELGERRSDYETLYPKVAGFRGVREVAREAYPLLVTFTDIADPTTVKRVDPDDLAATFGPGVALKRITLEITDEAVTEGEVEAVLGWLRWSRERFLAAGGGENPLRAPDNSPVGYETIGRTKFIRR
ncbi:twin-arginine translocation signal domain-containing protein [Nitratireductor arenosus]|uniref:twin-arginine translocation signal domain-containing protein n=1 Tax=Nitratireductor arenosus TaxID=2682096 RepID=UPI0012EB0376|nr:twin-arginine translocation signal domain-containing protein [Nitratireductor arenosus]